MKTIALFIISTFIFCVSVKAQTAGTSCTDPVPIWPAVNGDCTNGTNGAVSQWTGQGQCLGCPSCDCTDYLPGTTSMDFPCSASQNESTQDVIWGYFQEPAGATTLTLTNTTNWVGGGSANYEYKNYMIYSGTCGSLTAVACIDGSVGYGGSGAMGDGGSCTITGLTPGQMYYIVVADNDADGQSVNAANYQTQNTCITSTTTYVNPYDNCTSGLNASSNIWYNLNTANLTASGAPYVCAGANSGSVENDMAIQWCAPATWVAGTTAYAIFNGQDCASWDNETAQTAASYTSGIQLAIYPGTLATQCPLILNGTATEISGTCNNPGVINNYNVGFTATASQCYTIMVDGYAGVACQFDFMISATVPLGVSIAEFKGVSNGSENLISWSSAAEEDMREYVLEAAAVTNQTHLYGRSESSGDEPLEWVTVATITAHNAASSYSYADKSPFSEDLMYRLRGVDFDGETTLSNAIEVMNNGLTYANPVRFITRDAQSYILDWKDDVTIDRIEVISLTGAIASCVNAPNGGSHTIHTSDMPNGSYIARVIASDGGAYSFRFAVAQ